MDAHGDTMFGTLAMGSHGISLNGALLQNTGTGLRYGGSPVCLQTEAGCPAYLRSDVSDTFTGGNLDMVGNLRIVGSGSVLDKDEIFFDDGVSEVLEWDDYFGRFEVSDDVAVPAAHDFQYQTPRAFSYNIPAADFQPDSSAEDEAFTHAFSGGYIKIAGGTTPFDLRLVAGVHLPDGASITQVSLMYYDNDAVENFADLRFGLFTRQLSSTVVTILSSPPLTSSSGAGSAVLEVSDKVPDGLGFSPPLENAKSHLWMEVSPIVTKPSPDLRFYGVQIDYNLETLRPSG